jgi:predicted porin
MRKLLMVLAVLAIPAASHAGGFTLGLRLGYGAGGGDLGGAYKLSDVTTSQVPFQVDAMYRVNPELAFGGYFSFGIGGVSGAMKDQCDAGGFDCSTSSVRAGIQGTYTFTMLQSFVPWVGVGTGYEALSVSASGSVNSVDYTGWEYLNLQVGGDYKVSPLFAFGPYLQYAVGQFSNEEGTAIPDKSTHSWFNIGIRGKFDFGAK